MRPFKTLLPWMLALVLLTSCDDTLEEARGLLTGENEVTLTLPGVVYAGEELSARADGEADATTDERLVSSLWLMAYPTQGSEGETLVRQLFPAKGQLTHEYQSFDITLKHGTYQIYVVANVPGISYNTTEQELQEKIISYAAADAKTITLPQAGGQGLPMAYKREQPYTLSYDSREDIYADLTYCCSKVRYTLLFDNSSEQGFSHAAFGDKGMRMEQATGRHFATQAPVIAGTQQTVTTLDTPEGALNGLYADGDYSEEQPEATPFTQQAPSNYRKWAYRGQFYVPEHFAETADEESRIDLSASLTNEQGTALSALRYSIPLGDDPDESTSEETARPLPRGKYYDITARVNSLGELVDVAVAVAAWTVEAVNAQLEAPYTLWVEETQLTDELRSGDVMSVACRTNSPTLDYKSVNVSVNGKDVPLFVVDFAKTGDAYTGFSVKVNPALPPTKEVISAVNTLEEKHVWIRIPDPEIEGGYLLSKKIVIDQVNLEPYLNVTPPRYDIYINEVNNQPTHTVTFSYETNLSKVAVTTEDGSTLTALGSQWSRNENITLTDGGLKEGQGTVTVTLKNLQNLASYKNAQTLTLHYTATDDTYEGELTASTLVNIVPNAQKYRLHFRPVTDDWTNPHIYVYQVLYAPDGKEVRLPPDSNGQFEHAVLYGFTGKRTFTGWTSQGGDINDPGTGTSTDVTDQSSYWQAPTAWDPNNTANGIYSTMIDYCPGFRSGTVCSTCNTGAITAKWPGVGMKVDEDNPGWYYFDLPALASPGKTLIMFANGHSGSTADDKHWRYPAHLIPGVPLYDFADKDGWFLYDYEQAEQEGFVDDKPDILGSLEVGMTLRLWASDSKYNRVHIWGAGDLINNGYGTDAENLSTENGRKYYDITITETWHPTRVIYCMFYNNNNDKTGDITIYLKDWKKVTGKTYQYETTK